MSTARNRAEQWVGEGIRASGIARGELFVTTKVTEDDAKADDFARSVDTSLQTMGLDYVDMLLVHWPQPRVPLSETLGALAKAKRQGLAKNIGVSNFTVALLDEATESSRRSPTTRSSTTPTSARISCSPPAASMVCSSPAMCRWPAAFC